MQIGCRSIVCKRDAVRSVPARTAITGSLRGTRDVDIFDLARLRCPQRQGWHAVHEAPPGLTFSSFRSHSCCTRPCHDSEARVGRFPPRAFYKPRVPQATSLSLAGGVLPPVGPRLSSLPFPALVNPVPRSPGGSNGVGDAERNFRSNSG